MNQIAAEEAYGCGRRSALGLLSAAAAAAVAWPAAQPALAAATADEQLPKGVRRRAAEAIPASEAPFYLHLGATVHP